MVDGSVWGRAGVSCMQLTVVWLHWGRDVTRVAVLSFVVSLTSRGGSPLQGRHFVVISSNACRMLIREVFDSAHHATLCALWLITSPCVDGTGWPIGTASCQCVLLNVFSWFLPDQFVHSTVPANCWNVPLMSLSTLSKWYPILARVKSLSSTVLYVELVVGFIMT